MSSRFWQYAALAGASFYFGSAALLATPQVVGDEIVLADGLGIGLCGKEEFVLHLAPRGIAYAAHEGDRLGAETGVEQHLVLLTPYQAGARTSLAHRRLLIACR